MRKVTSAQNLFHPAKRSSLDKITIQNGDKVKISELLTDEVPETVSVA